MRRLWCRLFTRRHLREAKRKFTDKLDKSNNLRHEVIDDHAKHASDIVQQATRDAKKVIDQAARTNKMLKDVERELGDRT
jgi:RecA/RadA recombinase